MLSWAVEIWGEDVGIWHHVQVRGRVPLGCQAHGDMGPSIVGFEAGRCLNPTIHIFPAATSCHLSHSDRGHLWLMVILVPAI